MGRSFGWHRLVGLATVDPFIGSSERTDMFLNPLHQRKREAALLASRPPTDRTVLTHGGEDFAVAGVHDSLLTLATTLRRPRRFMPAGYGRWRHAVKTWPARGFCSTGFVAGSTLPTTG